LMQNEPQVPNRDAKNRDVWIGLGLTLLLHLIQIPLASLTVNFSLFALGVSQLIYIIPAIVIFQHKGRPGVVKGLIIGAALTLLLNATCAVLVFSDPARYIK